MHLCMSVHVSVCGFVYKEDVDGKRRGDAEKGCCVGEVLTCSLGSCVASTNHIIDNANIMKVRTITSNKFVLPQNNHEFDILFPLIEM